jgi:hypothetical protein
MTAGGQMTVGAHSEALPPVAFRINIPVMAMRISRGNPYRMFTRRLFPPASLPVIGATVIAVVSAHPDVLPAWADGTMLVDADRGTKFYYDLRISRYPKRKAKQDGKNQFSHFLLLRPHEQVYGRYRFSLLSQQKGQLSTERSSARNLFGGPNIFAFEISGLLVDRLGCGDSLEMANTAGKAVLSKLAHMLDGTISGWYGGVANNTGIAPIDNSAKGAIQTRYGDKG